MKVSSKALCWLAALAIIICAQQEGEKPVSKDNVAAVEETEKEAVASATDSATAEDETTDEMAESETAIEPENTTADSAEQAKAAVESTGGLKIISIPEDAVVVIDDVMKGRTPAEIDGLAAGEHTLLLKKKGHFLKKATVAVRAGEMTELSFELTKPVDLVITSEPSKAAVSVDGKQVGATPCVAGKLKPGEHAVVLALDGYEEVKRTVNLGTADSDTLHAKLVRIETDSTKAAAAAKVPKKSKLANRIALAVFLAFALVIVIVELADTNE